MSLAFEYIAIVSFFRQQKQYPLHILVGIGTIYQWYPNHLSVGAVQYEFTSTQAKYAHFRTTDPRGWAASADRDCQRGDVRDTRLVPLGALARGTLGTSYAHCPWDGGGDRGSGAYIGGTPGVAESCFTA